MQQSLQQTISLLTRTPATLNALLRDLPETWTKQNEGEDTWNVSDVVAHLIHGERTDWMSREQQRLISELQCEAVFLNAKTALISTPRSTETR